MTIISDARHSAWTVFLIFLRLGLTSFGGPVAHLGYFRDEFVVRRQWVSERGYADLVALCQFLPGPASSQVGIALGLSRSGYVGALAAWAGFTFPSAIFMTLFAVGVVNYGETIPSGVLQGLKIVAVAVVAQAVWGMARNFCQSVLRVVLMLAAASFVLFFPSVWGPVGVIVMAAAIGMFFFNASPMPFHDSLTITLRRRTGAVWLSLFFCLLIGLPILAALFPGPLISVFDAFYRTGSLVFGGGHVVLPLLQAEVVAPGWISDDFFLTGYGVAQAVPGPLFTFSAFLGASMNEMVSGVWGALVCLIAIFLPSFFLVMGVLPFWEHLRKDRRIQAALSGVNAAVVGILLAALYDPVWVSAIDDVADFMLLLLALTALMVWKLPPWLVVSGGALMGGLLSLVL